jgi:Cys-tRNA(Pro)/Cys-tRNA(Cys) deacylase
MHHRIREILDKSAVPFKVHLHAQLRRPIRSPQDFATELDYDLARITKTLLLRCMPIGQYALVVCSTGKRVNFVELARHCGARRVEVARETELHEKLGYPTNGVSPIGGDIRIIIDDALFNFPTICFGAGEPGAEIEMSPYDLRNITGADVLSVVK